MYFKNIETFQMHFQNRHINKWFANRMPGKCNPPGPETVSHAVENPQCNSRHIKAISKQIAKKSIAEGLSIFYVCVDFILVYIFIED